MRMRHIVIFGLPGSTIFFHIFSQIAGFSEKNTEHKMCYMIFSTTFVWIFLWRIKRDIIINVHRSSVQLLLDNTQHSQQTFMPPAGFETAVSANERPLIDASDSAATRIGKYTELKGKRY